MWKQATDITAYSGPFVMALSLDKEKKTERIIIGRKDEMDAWFSGIGKLTAIFDVVRPLGAFLLEHRGQNREEWAQYAGGLLQEAAASFSHRKEKETAAWNYLESKQDSHNMVSEFVVCQSWHWYQTCRTPLGSQEKSREFSDRFLYLTRSFKQLLWEETGACSLDAAWDAVQRELNGRVRASVEQKMDFRYSARNRKEEWLLITESYYPALQYYLRKLMEWELCFCRCSVCNRIFIADSRHYSLCSAGCRTIQNRENKRKFDEKARENGYDRAYKNTCQRMRNTLKKIETLELYSEAEAWFKTFRKEATRRKKQISNAEDSRAFQDWMFAQERAFEQLYGR